MGGLGCFGWYWTVFWVKSGWFGVLGRYNAAFGMVIFFGGRKLVVLRGFGW